MNWINHIKFQIKEFKFILCVCRLFVPFRFFLNPTDPFTLDENYAVWFWLERWGPNVFFIFQVHLTISIFLFFSFFFQNQSLPEVFRIPSHHSNLFSFTENIPTNCVFKWNSNPRNSACKPKFERMQKFNAMSNVHFLSHFLCEMDPRNLFSEMTHIVNTDTKTETQIKVKNEINGMFTNDLHHDFKLKGFPKRSLFGIFDSLWNIFDSLETLGEKEKKNRRMKFHYLSISKCKCYLYTRKAQNSWVI